ncbi:MAG: LiaI-LiaF-like domain-containing protein [Bryobacteraceae bacterium]
MRRHRPFLSPGVIAGLLVMAMGMALLLRNLGLVRRLDIEMVWSFLLLVGGVANMLSGPWSKRLIGLLVASLGSYWLLDEFGMVSYPFWRIWPAFLMALGAILLYRALSRRKGVEQATSATMLNEFVMFGGVGRKLNTQEFAGGQLFAACGGHEIDLTQAGFQDQAVYVDANVIFGGIEIKIPAGWSASVEGIAIFGGYEDSTIQPKIEEGAAIKRIVVRGFAVFGGVEVKN